MTTEPMKPCGECGMPCTSGEYHPYAACLMFKACHNSETVRANLDAVRGHPSGAGEPVAPDFYTACAWYEGGGESGWIALPGYSNETEHGVKHLILEAARKEGYKGTITGRLMELGWEIRPVYLTPQPTQAVPPAGREPLTGEQIQDAAPKYYVEDFLDFNAGVRFAEQHHGIKGKEAGNADQ